MSNGTFEFITSNLTMSGSGTFVTESLPWWNKAFAISLKNGKILLAMRFWVLIVLVLLFGLFSFIIYKFAKGRNSAP